MRLQLSSSTAPPRRIMRCHGKRSSSSAQDQEKRNTQKGEDSFFITLRLPGSSAG